MKGISAKPLEGFSSLHEGVLLHFAGMKMGRLTSVFSFNMEVPLPPELLPTLIFYSHPIGHSVAVPREDFCIDQLTQWSIDLTSFKSFDDYLGSMNYKGRYNYNKTEKRFAEYGCNVTVKEGDWSEHADKVYALYRNVAAKYMQIYDLEFFRALSKQSTNKLICAWRGEKLIGSLVMVEDGSTVHSMGCGLDYVDSKSSFTYSRLHYEFIRLAIDGQYKIADAGVTADGAKGTLGFSPKPAVLKVFAQNPALRAILRMANRVIRVSINSENNVKVRLRLPNFYKSKKRTIAKYGPFKRLLGLVKRKESKTSPSSDVYQKLHERVE